MTGPWTTGREIVNLAGTGPIDVALAKHTDANGMIHEEALYDELDYPPPDANSHGTHVMDIAAGNGSALFSREGVAPEAELIFVQLRSDLVMAGGAGLMANIAEGVKYIFDRVKQMEAQAGGDPIPAVVNISFGNNLGPHDGTSGPEVVFEDQLKTRRQGDRRRCRQRVRIEVPHEWWRQSRSPSRAALERVCRRRKRQFPRHLVHEETRPRALHHAAERTEDQEADPCWRPALRYQGRIGQHHRLRRSYRPRDGQRRR